MLLKCIFNPLLTTVLYVRYVVRKIVLRSTMIQIHIFRDFKFIFADYSCPPVLRLVPTSSMTSSSPQVRWKQSPIRIRSPTTLTARDQPTKEDSADVSEREERIRQSFFESILSQSASLMFEGEVQTPPSHLRELTVNDVPINQKSSGPSLIDPPIQHFEEVYSNPMKECKEEIPDCTESAGKQESDGNNDLKEVDSSSPSHALQTSDRIIHRMDHRLGEAHAYLLEVESRYPSPEGLPLTLDSFAEREVSFSEILEKVSFGRCDDSSYHKLSTKH